MTFLYIIAGIVLFLVFVHLLVGWHVSNGLHREVLAVRPRSKELGVWVRSVADGRIELESPLPRQDIGHPGVFGLIWTHGSARVGDVVGAPNGRISRLFTPGESGAPPECHGQLIECEPVELDGYVYPLDPSDVGLDFEEVSYDSALGPLGAWLVPSDSEASWAIQCHGWTAERRELIRMLPEFHRQHRTSLVIDYRNDAGAPNDPSGRHRFGTSEWQDLESAVRFAVARGAKDVVLMGCSTGAALVMAFLEHSELASLVTGVVMDAPNIVLADTFRLGLRDVRLTQLVKETGLLIAGLRWHIDWKATNFVERADDIVHIPTLVFHGTSDLVVPISGSRQLQAKVPDLVQLVETQAAGHVLSWNADSERYDNYLGRFLERL